MKKRVIAMPNDDEIYHYASEYYDPVKAHEYYMQKRILKGRTTGVKNTSTTSVSRKSTSENKRTITEMQRDEMKARTEELRKEIAESISKRIKRLSNEDKKRVGDEIKNLIDQVRDKGIGTESEKVHESQRQKQKAWETSESYKRAVKETDKLDRMFDQGKISVNDYDREYAKVWDKAFESAPTTNTYAVTGRGRKYTNDYVSNLGRNLTVAYLKDLGFNDEASKYIDSIIKKSGAQVLD